MSEYSEISDRISKEIADFTAKLKDSGLQHTSTKSFGEIVEHYAKAIIDTEFLDTKVTMMDGAVKLIKELKEE